MTTYSIRDLEKLSGIKAHTIRIWEQRYHLIEPKRTPTNIRYYTDEDLKYLLNIAFLNKNGVRISKISGMSREDVAAKVASISKASNEQGHRLQAMTMSMVELNEVKFRDILDKSVAEEGWEHTLMELVVPFLEKMSLLWLTGSVSLVHEQFVHCILRAKILAATEVLERSPQAPRFLLCAPKSEDQELGLLIAQFFLRQRGFEVMYLGAGLSLNDLEIAGRLYQPHFVYLLFGDHRSKQSPEDYLRELQERLPKVFCLVAGLAPEQFFQLQEGVRQSPLRLFEDLADFSDFLDELLFDVKHPQTQGDFLQKNRSDV